MHKIQFMQTRDSQSFEEIDVQTGIYQMLSSQELEAGVPNQNGIAMEYFSEGLTFQLALVGQ